MVREPSANRKRGGLRYSFPRPPPRPVSKPPWPTPATLLHSFCRLPHLRRRNCMADNTTSASSAPAPWITTAKAPGGSYEVPPAGAHLGWGIALIDLGTHEEELKDRDGVARTKEFRKLAIVLELPGC